MTTAPATGHLPTAVCLPPAPLGTGCTPWPIDLHGMDEFGFDDDALASFDLEAAIAAAPAKPAAASPAAAGSKSSHVSPAVSPPEQEEPDWDAIIAMEQEAAAAAAGGPSSQQPGQEQEIPDDILDDWAGGSQPALSQKRAIMPATRHPPAQSQSQSQVVVPRGRVPSDSELLAGLQEYYGHHEFREGQLEAIRAVLQGKDVSVFWATGQGKSLVYQLPALVTGRVSLVVSPLISLMMDQVQALNHTTGQGECACFLGKLGT
jgi:hypothetical protein